MIHWRKSISFLIMLVLVFFATGCTESRNTEGVDSMLNDGVSVPTLEIQVAPSSINVSAIPEFIKITVTNTSEDLEYKGSYHYSIEYWDGEKWDQVLGPAVPDEEIIIRPADSAVFEYIQLNPAEHDYSIGEYRVNYNNYGYGEFSIVDER